MPILIILIFYSFSLDLNSRPISYTGGWTIIQNNELETNSFLLHYSPSPKYSIGSFSNYFRKKNYLFEGLRVNFLLKRLNKKKSQTNLYFKGDLGKTFSTKQKVNDQKLSFTTGLAFDWETRKYFVKYENTYSDFGKIDNFFKQKIKLGFAPYLANFGQLHTWVMIQLDHRPGEDEKIMFTPLVRLFKYSYMIEMGLSNKFKPLINLAIRF